MGLSAILESSWVQKTGLISGIISSMIIICGVILYFGGGIDMAYLWSQETVVTIFFILAVINTAITFIAIYWGSIQTKNLSRTTRKCRNDELEKLIKPFLLLDSNRENPIKGAHLAFSEIKRYGNLAQPELRNLLRQYCEIREENPRLGDKAPSYQMNHQKRLTETTKQIFVLVEKRYKELMWEVN